MQISPILPSMVVWSYLFSAIRIGFQMSCPSTLLSSSIRAVNGSKQKLIPQVKKNDNPPCMHLQIYCEINLMCRATFISQRDGVSIV